MYTSNQYLSYPNASLIFSISFEKLYFRPKGRGIGIEKTEAAVTLIIVPTVLLLIILCQNSVMDRVKIGLSSSLVLLHDPLPCFLFLILLFADNSRDSLSQFLYASAAT